MDLTLVWRLIKWYTQKKWILEHYTCDGQLSIDDLPFNDENVDNFVTDVDNIIWHDTCMDCVLIDCDRCDKFLGGGLK